MTRAAVAALCLVAAPLSAQPVDRDPGQPSYSVAIDPRRRSLMLAMTF